MILIIGRYYIDDPKTRSNGEFDIVTHDKIGYLLLTEASKISNLLDFGRLAALRYYNMNDGRVKRSPQFSELCELIN